MSLSGASLEPVDIEKGEGKGTEWRPEWRPESKLNKKKNLNVVRQSEKLATVTKRRKGLWREEEPGPTFSASFDGCAVQKFSVPEVSTESGALLKVFDQRSHPLAQCDILGQHLFRAFNRKLGPFDALLGIADFIGRHPVAVGFHDDIHRFPTRGGRYRSLMSGETGGAT